MNKIDILSLPIESDILITGHVNPDGDALGSGLALKILLDDLGYNSVISYDMAKDIPRNLKFLPVDIIENSNVLKRNLEEFKKYTGQEIFEQRKEKFLNIGKQKNLKVFSSEINWIKKNNFFATVIEILFKFKKRFIILSFLILMKYPCYFL